LSKKHGDLLEKIIKAGFKIASEDVEDAEEDTEKPADFAVYMLLSCATEVPNTVSWPLFKANTVECWQSTDISARKAALKILGFVSESDALLDPIKDDVDELSDLLVTALKDQSEVVREAAAMCVAEFSENVIPDFLDLHEKILPCLLTVLKESLESIASSGQNNQGKVEAVTKSLIALAEFTGNMEIENIKPYTATCVQVCMTCCTNPQKFDR
jgi:DNA-binding protein YbaB